MAVKKTVKKKAAVKRVGSGERTAKGVKYNSSHLDPKSVKAKKGGGHGKVDVMQGVPIREYPGERGGGRKFKGIKTIDSRG